MGDLYMHIHILDGYSEKNSSIRLGLIVINRVGGWADEVDSTASQINPLWVE
jgi:hypothetical protein